MSALCLVALRLVHEWAAAQCLLYLSYVDVLHRFCQRINLVPNKDCLYLVNIEETVNYPVPDVYPHLVAHHSLTIRLVKGCYGKQQIHCECHINDYYGGLLPIHVVSVYYFSFSSSRRVISGT